jgi:hypothetical protein
VVTGRWAGPDGSSWNSAHGRATARAWGYDAAGVVRNRVPCGGKSSRIRPVWLARKRITPRLPSDPERPRHAFLHARSDGDFAPSPLPSLPQGGEGECPLTPALSPKGARENAPSPLPSPPRGRGRMPPHPCPLPQGGEGDVHMRVRGFIPLRSPAAFICRVSLALVMALDQPGPRPVVSHGLVRRAPAGPGSGRTRVVEDRARGAQCGGSRA